MVERDMRNDLWGDSSADAERLRRGYQNQIAELQARIREAEERERKQAPFDPFDTLEKGQLYRLMMEQQNELLKRAAAPPLYMEPGTVIRIPRRAESIAPKPAPKPAPKAPPPPPIVAPAKKRGFAFED